MIITVYPGYTLLHTTRMMVDRYRTLYVAVNEYIDIIAGQHAVDVRSRAIICTMTTPNGRPILSTTAGRYETNNCAVCILSVAVGVVHESPIYVKPLLYPYHNSVICINHPAVYVFINYVVSALHEVLLPE